jgi:hypothetical protein
LQVCPGWLLSQTLLCLSRHWVVERAGTSQSLCPVFVACDQAAVTLRLLYNCVLDDDPVGLLLNLSVSGTKQSIDCSADECWKKSFQTRDYVLHAPLVWT